MCFFVTSLFCDATVRFDEREWGRVGVVESLSLSLMMLHSVCVCVYVCVCVCVYVCVCVCVCVVCRFGERMGEGGSSGEVCLYVHSYDVV